MIGFPENIGIDLQMVGYPATEAMPETVSDSIVRNPATGLQNDGVSLCAGSYHP